LNKKKLELNLILLYINVFGEIPSSIDEASFLVTPEKAAPAWLAINGYESYTRLITGFKTHYTINKNLSNTTIIHGKLMDAFESRPFNILDDKSYMLGFRSYFSFNNSAISVRSGIEYNFEEYDWSLYETLEGIQGKELNSFREKPSTSKHFYTIRFKVLF
jgi:iron complex outermembrane receptor protein